MDEVKDTHSVNAGQGAPRVHQRCDGTWVVVRDEGSVSFIEKLTIVSRPTAALDRFEAALHDARKMLPDGIAAGVTDDALALFDHRLHYAFEALREALKR